MKSTILVALLLASTSAQAQTQSYYVNRYGQIVTVTPLGPPPMQQMPQMPMQPMPQMPDSPMQPMQPMTPMQPMQPFTVFGR